MPYVPDGLLASIPFFILTVLLIAFGQRGGMFVQLLLLGSLGLGLIAATSFLGYAVAAFFADDFSQQGPAGKIVELVLAGIVFLPLLACLGGMLLFWGSDMFRAQASRMGALFIGLQGAFLVYAGYSFPVAIALIVIVSLLCIEWLSRKLLRLA